MGKSKSSVYIEINGNALYKSTRRQGVIAKSSAEGELYAASAAGSELASVKQLLEWAGFSVEARLYVDSSSARALAQKGGAGSIRHLRIHVLWIQDAVRTGLFRICEISGDRNPADLGTKALPRRRLEELRARIGLRVPRAPEQEEATKADTTEAMVAAMIKALSVRAGS